MTKEPYRKISIWACFGLPISFIILLVWVNLNDFFISILYCYSIAVAIGGAFFMLNTIAAALASKEHRKSYLQTTLIFIGGMLLSLLVIAFGVLIMFKDYRG